jgi:hypothetical protein
MEIYRTIVQTWNKFTQKKFSFYVLAERFEKKGEQTIKIKRIIVIFALP